MAARLRFAAEIGSVKLGLQSFNCCKPRNFGFIVPLRRRLWSLRRLLGRAVADADVHFKEVTKVERERHPFSEKVVTLPEVSKAQQAADVWEDNEENRKRRWAAWNAAKAEKAASQIVEKLSLGDEYSMVLW